MDPNLIGTSSIDTTCTIWGLETSQVIGRINTVGGHVKTQLIAHDKEVYDIAFSRAGGGRDMFASVGMYLVLNIENEFLLCVDFFIKIIFDRRRWICENV